MKDKAYIILNGFLEKISKKEQDKLLSFLQDSEVKLLKNSLKPSFDIDPNLFFNDGLIDTIHYSWFIPSINIYSKNEAYFFIASVKKDTQDKLLKLLKLKNKKITITENGKKFLRSILLDSLIEKNEDLLPIEYLPASPLNALLEIPKNMLIQLIDYLSLYDLAKELKFIVEKKKLQNIYSFLSKKEQTFLNKILKYNEPFSTQKLNLEKFDGDKKKIKSILHKRGLERLAKALSGENDDLIWYVCHFMDIGRGAMLHKLCKTKKTVGVSDVITSQILNIISTLQKS